MPKTTATDKKICDAALKLAATKDWSTLTLDQIAKTAKLPVAQIKKLFPDTSAILPAIVRQIDRQVMASVSKVSAAATPHDRLFDVMMTRFEILQSHRHAFLHIAASIKRNPSLARHLLPAHAEAMKKMLTLADLQQGSAQQLLAVAGLLAVYAIVFCSWERDETKDLSKTMAALDRHLRRVGKCAEILFRAT